MRNKKTAFSIFAVIIVLSLMGWMVGCQKDADELVDAQGVKWGQYGSAWFHGSVYVDNDVTILDDLTITDVVTAADLTATDDVTVGDTLDVNGDIDLDGDGFDVNITAAFSIDGDAASNINVAGALVDLTLESEAGRLVLKGDEAAADGVFIDANDAVTTGLTIIVGSASGLSIDGGMTDIGGCTAGTADGDNDLCVAAVLEVDGATDLDGTLAVAGVATFAALANLSFADETITDGEVLVPTVNVYSLDTGGAVTMTIGITGAVEGQLLILINDDANAIIIDDSDISTSDGNAITLSGAEDIVVFIFQDVTWHELLTIANS